MTEQTRAYLAFAAGGFFVKEEVKAIYDQDEEQFLEREDLLQLSTSAHPARTDCGVSRDLEAENYCITSDNGRHHVCLSLYGKLFEGYDHGTESHFSGFVDDGMLTLYDFAESKFFTFDIQP